jgi:hypothetical protein
MEKTSLVMTREGTKETYALLFTYHYNPEAPEDIRNQGVTLAPGDYVLLKIDVPKTGYIKKLIINIPPGCTNKVKFRLFLNQTQIFPASGWFGFENFTQALDFIYPVKEGDKLYLEAINRGTMEHFISITVLIE